MSNKVGIVMGSDSDLPVMKAAASLLEKMGIEYDMIIASAHRTPELLTKFISESTTRGTKVFIAGAGGAAHLPGVVAAGTTLPVIGIPIKTSTLSGVDSLYSIVQMPSGIPVATVAINGAENAGILAAQILGISDPAIAAKVEEHRNAGKTKVEDKAKKLKELGYEAYIEKFLK